MKIVTVKLGDKYDSSFVNRVYKMCQKNLTIPFNFYCYTEDPSGLDPNIIVVDHTDLGIKPVYYKLLLFRLFDSAVYFDLDVVIQKNIDWIQNNIRPNKLTLIKTYMTHQGRWRCNSSVMAWNNMSKIWHIFNNHRELHLEKYTTGIDNFLSNRNYQMTYFNRFDIYSRLHGIYEWDGPIPLGERHKEYYYPDISICIFNSYGKTIDHRKGILLDDKSYEGMEHYWS